MAYPTTIDTFTTHATGDVIEASYDNSQQVAISALEAKVGVDSSAVTTSHDYKLSGVTSSDKAVSKTGTETLTNKTLTAPIITSPTINLTSDAEGDTYYRNSSGAFVRLARGTDNFIYKMNGNVPNWEAEATIADATSTTAGLVELATAAEITAGTATGGDGPLTVTPDQLALSTPVFNGSGLTNLTMKSTSNVSNGPSSSTTQTITHNLGKTPKIVRLTGYCPQAGGVSTGLYDDSGNRAVNRTVIGGTITVESSNSYAIKLYDDQATDGISTGVVGNLTSTQFDIVWTVTQGDTSTCKFIWEAE